MKYFFKINKLIGVFLILSTFYILCMHYGVSWHTEILSSNGVTHNVVHSLDSSIRPYLGAFTSAISGYVSLQAGMQAATYIPHPVGKLTAFVGTFGVSMGLQRTFATSLSSDSLFQRKVDSSIESTPINVSARWGAKHPTGISGGPIGANGSASTSNIITDNQAQVTESLKVSATESELVKIDSNFVANSTFESGDQGFLVNNILSDMILLSVSGLCVLILLGIGILFRELRLEDKINWIKSRSPWGRPSFNGAPRGRPSWRRGPAPARRRSRRNGPPPGGSPGDRPFLLKLATLNMDTNRTVLLFLFILAFLSMLGLLLSLINITLKLESLT